MINKVLRNLQAKHDCFIGNRKDQITSAKAEGFKKGLAWAIDSIKTGIEQEQIEEEFNREEAQRIAWQNSYTYDDNGNCDGSTRKKKIEI
jgi:hypothetical protein